MGGTYTGRIWKSKKEDTNKMNSLIYYSSQALTLRGDISFFWFWLPG
jgi:hypothetical protein